MSARSLLSRFPSGGTRDTQAARGFEVSRFAGARVGTLGTPGSEACPECPESVANGVGTLEPAESLSVPTVPICPERIEQGEARCGDPADFAESTAWHEMPDVRLMVENLFRTRWHPRRIARELGLTRAEVGTILAQPDMTDSKMTQAP